jgi:serine/threonine protein kinase/Flp pilus assembly protein TadD
MATPSVPVIAICSICGEPLNGNSGCLVCLIRAGLDESVAKTKPLASLVFGDFEVEQRADGFYWELGHGAMGVTYLATDKMLRRRVALKVIDVPAAARGLQAVRDRFLREARAAAALRHPNVAAVFQFGASPDASHCYYAMELVEGETLEARVRRDGPLEAEPAVEIALQITRALMAAAAQGLIHRDLKPSNIMLASGKAATADLTVKVIDFGLAKAITDAEGEMDLTHGHFIGTPAFASPEQFGSGSVDARADIYSLGATIWFALTGLAPRSGNTIEEIRDRHARDNLSVEQLVARKVPASIIKLLRCTLSVDPSKRPASAAELMQALESCRRKLPHGTSSFYKLAALITVAGLAATGYFMLRVNRQPAPSSAKNIATLASALAIPAKSIAVLPFENRSVDKANAYFADGIQDEILTRLLKIADLKVISRASTQHYKSAPENLPEIARELGVAHILEGSVQKSGDTVRVNVQLIDAANDSHLWGDTFDRKLTDIFSVESEVAKAITDQLQAHITGEEEQVIAAKPTDNAEAYDAYLHGLAYGLRSGYQQTDNLDAIKHFGEAVKLDPKFGLAWAWLARESALGYWNLIGGDVPALRETAKDAARKAIEFLPNLAEAYLAQGFVFYYCERDYDSAIASFEKAEQLSPKNSQVPEALGLVWRRKGQWQRSLKYFRKAIELDPRDISLLSQEGDALRQIRQYSAALKACDQVLEISPDNGDTLAKKVGIYQAEGNLSAAAPVLSRLHLDPRSELFSVQIEQWMYERRYNDAIAALKDVIGRNDRPLLDSQEIDYTFTLALLQQFSGDTAAAHVTWQQVQTKVEQFRSRSKSASTPALGLEQLASAYVALGDKTKAFAFVKEAQAEVSASKDEFWVAQFAETIARISAQAGEKGLALDELAISVQKSGGVTYGDLKLNPLWDSVRGDSRFEKIIAAVAPK